MTCTNREVETVYARTKPLRKDGTHKSRTVNNILKDTTIKQHNQRTTYNETTKIVMDLDNTHNLYIRKDKPFSSRDGEIAFTADCLSLDEILGQLLHYTIPYYSIIYDIKYVHRDTLYSLWRWGVTFHMYSASDKGTMSHLLYSLWRWGVTFHDLDVSHETPDVTPCRTSPPMPVVRTSLERNARFNTMSHLTAAGCKWRVMTRLSPNRLKHVQHKLSLLPVLGPTARNRSQCALHVACVRS